MHVCDVSQYLLYLKFMFRLGFGLGLELAGIMRHRHLEFLNWLCCKN